jgi:hypothetical protein
MPDDRRTSHASYSASCPEPSVLTRFLYANRPPLRSKTLWKQGQFDDLAPAAAAPEAWLESEPAWSIAVLK